VASHLRSRGHAVTFLSDASWQERAQARNLAFDTLLSKSNIDTILGHPDFWHPLKGGIVASRWGAPLVPAQFELISKHAQTPHSILVASPGVIAARMVQETRSIPTASVLLQPGLIPSIDSPPAMPGIPYPRWAPRPIGRLYWSFVHLAGHLLIGRKLTTFRANLGLPPIRRLFDWWLSPDLVLGLFPDWYGPLAPDWPPQLRLTGFPLTAGQSDDALPPDLISFLNTADPPIAVTFGTGMMHAAKLFAITAQACQLLNRRAIFLTRFPNQLPHPLPPQFHHAPAAPFHRLFPRCAAVIHHGGVGTTAKALAAGIPQLVIPFAFDQPDNAARVRALGVGDSLKPSRATPQRLAKTLSAILDGHLQPQCRACAHKLATDNALDLASDHLEALPIK
jgi:rhamnosyltransferase subunit B